MVARVAGQVGADVAAQDGEGKAGGTRDEGVGHPARPCSSSPRGPGQSCSTASRRRYSEPTPGLPPHEKISARTQPAPISWS